MKYKIYCYLLISCFVPCLKIQAELRQFKVSGKIFNGTGFKNVCFLSQGLSFLGKAEINKDKFEFQGNYDTDEWPYFQVIMTDMDSISAKDFSKDRSLIRGLNRVYYASEILLNYDVQLATWSASGSNENDLYKNYIKNQIKYNSKIDSANRVIEGENVSAALKQEKKYKVSTSMYEMERVENLKLMNKSPNSVVTLVQFWNYPVMRYLPAAECRRIFSTFSDSLRNTPFGKRLDVKIKEYEATEKPVYPTAPKLNINDTMYVFSLKNAEDKTIKNTDVYKDYTLIDFWATWCIPCRKEIPALKQAINMFGKNGFRIISVSIDKAESAERWKAAVVVQEMEKFVNLINPEGTEGIAKELNISAIPANYLVDKQGKVVGINLTSSELLTLLTDRYDK